VRVAVTTLGCKVNQYDTAVMQRLFAEKAWTRVGFDEEADAYVVNSCTVTDRADADARRLARRARRTNPAARVIMTGCYAQTSPTVVAGLDYVDYVIGLGRLPDLLDAVQGELAERVAVSDLRQAGEVATLGIESFPGRTRAFVKVQEGCNLFCTFCIVPVARGRSRSVPPRKVIEEIDRLEARGYREIVLTGVHLGGYGGDLDPPHSLAWLLEAVAERAPRLRVRVSSIDPPEVDERFVDVLASSAVFCDHLHVPLQAGDDDVLARMRRQYTTADAAAALDRVRERLPDVCLGTDVITGFPGETEEEFERGLAWIEERELAYLHVFPYSQRSSTAAAKRWAPLPEHVAHERACRMRALDRRLRRRFQDRFIGRTASVLFETAHEPATGMLKGYSSNYLPVICDLDDHWANRIVDAEIVGRRGPRLEARPV
jgi:threonylcarbamoyladenosine tRNA methylthiotransferase MtaB